MTDVEQPQVGALSPPYDGILERVAALRTQSLEDRRSAIEADSVALGALINQLALQEAGLAEEHVLKPELVAQVSDILGRLGLNKMSYGIAESMRRVGGMY